MPWIVTLLVVVQVISASAIIILVLLQHGKGADMGAAFGSGASGSLFGASGSANFLSRSTAVIATVFFIATIGLAYSSNSMRASHGGGLMSTTVTPAPAPADGSAPPVPAPDAGVPQTGPLPASPAAPATGSGTAKPAAPGPAEKSAAIPK
jgi:preprotein translocase subunit SecG